MAARTTTALIACLFLLFSSQTVFAQSSDTSKKKESKSSQQSDDKDNEDEKADEKKEDKKAAKKADDDRQTTILYKIGASGSQGSGSLVDTLSEGVSKTSMQEAFEEADGIETGEGEDVASKPVVLPGRPLVTGALDKAEIQKVIKSHRNQITYCYEKQLVHKPGLAGLVKVKFTIAPTGKVIASMVRESDLGDREVESCLTKEIRTWIFPEPKGGGIVVVNYPFNFSTSDK
jgi:hypothetical protein